MAFSLPMMLVLAPMLLLFLVRCISASTLEVFPNFVCLAGNGTSSIDTRPSNGTCYALPSLQSLRTTTLDTACAGKADLPSGFAIQQQQANDVTSSVTIFTDHNCHDNAEPAALSECVTVPGGSYFEECDPQPESTDNIPDGLSTNLVATTRLYNSSTRSIPRSQDTSSRTTSVEPYGPTTGLSSTESTSATATHTFTLSSKRKASTAGPLKLSASESPPSSASTQLAMKTTVQGSAPDAATISTLSRVPTTFTMVTSTSLSISASPAQLSPTSQVVLANPRKEEGGTKRLSLSDLGALAAIAALIPAAILVYYKWRGRRAARATLIAQARAALPAEAHEDDTERLEMTALFAIE